MFFYTSKKPLRTTSHCHRSDYVTRTLRRRPREFNHPRLSQSNCIIVKPAHVESKIRPMKYDGRLICEGVRGIITIIINSHNVIIVKM